MVGCSHVKAGNPVPSGAVATAGGPLTYTGQKRCASGRGSGLPDGDVCAFIYETVADCDFVVAMPAGEKMAHQSVFGFICKEGSH
jgi:hypothetical protein